MRLFLVLMICFCTQAFAASNESELEQFVRLGVVVGDASANELDQFDLSRLRNRPLSDREAVLALKRIVSSGTSYCQLEQDDDYKQLPSYPSEKFKSPLDIAIPNGTINLDPGGKKVKLHLDL
jgi:hypothetical protein